MPVVGTPVETPTEGNSPTVPTISLTDLDIELGPEVFEIIDEFGKTVMIQPRTRSDYDPATGKATITEELTFYPKVSPPAQFKQKYIDGTNVKVGDMYVILPTQGLTFTPAKDMSVTIDSVKYAVVILQPLYTGEAIAAWILQLRS
jgi:hypothetical protein